MMRVSRLARNAAPLLILLPGGVGAQPPLLLYNLGEASASPLLPPPTRDPLAIDPAADPILALGRTAADTQQFRDAIAEAVLRHPAIGEARAGIAEAEAGRRGARQMLFPSVDASLSSYKVIAREFSNDPDNIVERSRRKSRTDAILAVQQPLIDFGAIQYRIAAAVDRVRAAGADTDSAADEIALRAVGAWYEVYGYRALVRLGEAFAAAQSELKGAVEERVRQGVSAPGDIARVDSYLALTATRVAGYRRSLADAEARYAELFGAPAPPSLQRAPLPVADQGDDRRVLPDEHPVPRVRSAEALAAAAREDARSARAETAPQLTAGIDAGRYGVFETDKDYDIRGRVTLRVRLFGGVDAQADQARARALAAQARAERVRVEADRDAAIAASDVRALREQLDALEANYIASRRSRDILMERFRVARGSLFDVLAAEDAYFETAAAYIRGLIELDTARYILLSRTGRLLESLSIESSEPHQK